MSWSDLPAFIEDKIMPEPNTGCWIWLGTQTTPGYGKISIGRKESSAHRLLFLCFNGLIPRGKVVDHICENKWCVNPEHLEAVTQGENVRRFFAKRHFCKNGHDLRAKGIRLVSGRIKMCVVCYDENQKRSIASRKVSRSISKRIRRDVLDGILDPYGLAI